MLNNLGSTCLIPRGKEALQHQEGHPVLLSRAEGAQPQGRPCNPTPQSIILDGGGENEHQVVVVQLLNYLLEYCFL